MGCGQSKIHLYPRKSKSKTNGKRTGHADSDADADEDEGKLEETEKNTSLDRENHEEELVLQDSKIPETDCELSVSLLRAKNLSLLQNQEISTSQQNFFQMLDKKIEEGPDYDSTSETEIALEEARLNALVQHWESASITASLCSSASRSLQSTPVHQAAITQAAAAAAASQCIIPSKLLNPPMKADFLPHNAAFKIQLPVEIPQSEQQQIMLSQIMQQMSTVSQQKPMNMISQKSSIPMVSASTTGPVLQMPNTSQQPKNPNLINMATASTSAQGSQLQTNVNTSPKRILDSRVLMNPPHLQTHHIQMSSLQAQPQHQYTMSTSPQDMLNGARSPRPSLNAIPNTQINLPMQTVYYNQPTMQRINSQIPMQQQQQQQQPQQFQQTQQASSFGDMVYNMQVQSSPTPDYRFPPAISVQRLAPQVQRQLRETQELIKDSCPQLYAAGYGSPGPPVRSQTRNPARRPTLETQFSQELS